MSSKCVDLLLRINEHEDKISNGPYRRISGDKTYTTYCLCTQYKGNSSLLSKSNDFMKILLLVPQLCRLEQITQKVQEIWYILRWPLFGHIFGI